MESLKRNCSQDNSCTLICKNKDCNNSAFMCSKVGCACKLEHINCKYKEAWEIYEHQILTKLNSVNPDLVRYIKKVEELFKVTEEGIKKSQQKFNQASATIHLNDHTTRLLRRLKDRDNKMTSAELQQLKIAVSVPMVFPTFDRLQQKSKQVIQGMNRLANIHQDNSKGLKGNDVGDELIREQKPQEQGTLKSLNRVGIKTIVCLIVISMITIYWLYSSHCQNRQTIQFLNSKMIDLKEENTKFTHQIQRAHNNSKIYQQIHHYIHNLTAAKHYTNHHINSQIQEYRHYNYIYNINSKILAVNTSRLNLSKIQALKIQLDGVLANETQISIKKIGQWISSAASMSAVQAKRQQFMNKYETTKLNMELALAQFQSNLVNISREEIHINTFIAIFNLTRHKSNVTLLYRGSVDGFAAPIFHSKCNHKGPTVTLAKLVNGKVIGGYTPINWTSEHTYKKSQYSSSFIFSLTNKEKLEINTFQDKEIYVHPDYGPTFGGGHDLYFSSNSNQNGNSYCKVGFTYNNRQSLYVHGTQESYTKFCGSSNFQVSELEVFSITLA